MTSQTKTKICHVSYSRLRLYAANDVTVKRVLADADVSVDAEWRTDKIWIQNSGIRTSLVNIRRLKTARWRRILWCRCAAAGGQQRVSQCSGPVYRLDLLLRQQQNAFDPIMIIIESSYHIVYRDNFDLSYRLSIGNSIWHIVTALNTAPQTVKISIFFP